MIRGRSGISGYRTSEHMQYGLLMSIGGLVSSHPR